MNISSWLIRVRAKKVTLQTFQIRITTLINLTYIILDLTFSTQVTMVTFCRGKLIFVSVFVRTIPQIKSRAIAWYVKIKIYGHFAVGFNRMSEYLSSLLYTQVQFCEFHRLIERIIKVEISRELFLFTNPDRF